MKRELVILAVLFGGASMSGAKTYQLFDLTTGRTTADFTITSGQVPMANVSGVITGTTPGISHISGLQAALDNLTNAGALTSGTLPAGRLPALSGDASTSAGSAVLTFATVNSNVGTFGGSTSIPTLTVDAKGRLTAVSGNVVIAPAGTLSGATLASGVTASSLRTFGTLGGHLLFTDDTYDIGASGATRPRAGYFSSSVSANRLMVGSSSTPIISGVGSPEGTVTANVGAIYLRTNGGTNTTLYIKDTGTGNTGWAAVATGAGSGTVTSVDVSGGTTGLTTSGGAVTSSGTITLAGTLAPASGGSTWRMPVDAVADANVATLATEQVVDSMTTNGSVVLLTAQSTQQQNGPWVTGTGAWTRPSWYDNNSTTQAVQGMSVHVVNGSNYAGTIWSLTTTGPVTIGLTGTSWTYPQMSLAGLGTTGNLPGSRVGTGVNAGAVTAGTMAADRISGGTAGAFDGNAITNLTAANLAQSTSGGRNLLNVTNPSAIAFPRFAADNSAVTRTPAQVRTDLTLVPGTDVQAWDADIDDLADGSLSGAKVGTGISGTNVTTGTVPNAQLTAAIRRGSFGGGAEGGGSAPAEQECGVPIYFPEACTITGYNIQADTAGSCVFDIWMEADSYDSGGIMDNPPTIADTITASAKPTLSSQRGKFSSTLTGWTTSIPAGATIIIKLQSGASTLTKVDITISTQY